MALRDVPERTNADELYLRPGDDMVIAFEGLMRLRTKIVAPR
jgi:acylpyruvate hydrolase